MSTSELIFIAKFHPMARSLLSIVFSFMLSATIFGQTEFSPVGATWSYSFDDFWTNFQGFMVVRYEKDTVINNFPSKKLARELLDSMLNTVELRSPLFIYQSNDSVFQVFNSGNLFLFKNHFELGETSFVAEYLWPSPLTVESINTLVIGGITTEKYTFEETEWPVNTTVIYEKFGPELGYFEDWHGSPHDLSSYKLMCYKDDNFPLTSIDGNSCFVLSPANEEVPMGSDLTIFPNPSNGAITIDLMTDKAFSMNLDIWDIAGKLLIHDANFSGNQVNISSLPNGLYVGNISNETQVLPFKFIKQ
ncbi:MAG: T9SS type A sorting domain-containing protein [Bacteroidetes bacterium]|nr:T9SS type A sorting domain-containing protein [Bacteroidota bacterium]